MTPTYYLHNGQLFEIDRMPPERHTAHKIGCTCTFCLSYIGRLKDFHTYLSTLQPIPHAFSGESRVIPPNQIEWKMKCDAVVDCDCKLVCSFHSHSSRRVATPKITEAQQVKCDVCGKEGGGHYINCTEHFKPLTAQPDKPRYELNLLIKNIPLDKWDELQREIFELSKKFNMVAVEQPSPTPETGEKDEFKTAVEALEIMASKHNLHIDIKYRPKLYNVAQKKGWTIKTMQSMFNDKSFVEAFRKACAFIYNAKGLNDEQPS